MNEAEEMFVLKRLSFLAVTYAFIVALMTPIYYVVFLATLEPVSWRTAFYGSLRQTVTLMLVFASLRWLFAGPLKSVARRGAV